MFTRIKATNLRIDAVYYSRKIKDDALPDTEYVFIHPTPTNASDELVFTVEVPQEHEIIVGGEGYYLKDADALKRHIASAKRAAEGKPIVYKWCDNRGNALCMTRTHDEFLFMYNMVNKGVFLSDAAAMLDFAKRHCQRNGENFELGHMFIDMDDGGFQM